MKVDNRVSIVLFFVVLAVSYFVWAAFIPYAIFVAHTLIASFYELKAADMSKEKEKSIEYKIQEFESRLGRVEMDQV